MNSLKITAQRKDGAPIVHVQRGDYSPPALDYPFYEWGSDSSEEGRNDLAFDLCLEYARHALELSRDESISFARRNCRVIADAFRYAEATWTWTERDIAALLGTATVSAFAGVPGGEVAAHAEH